MDIHTFLIVTHIIGAVLGVGGTTFAEIFYLKALKDGVIDPMESDWLRTVSAVLRVGTVIILFSGFALVFWNVINGNSEYLYNTRLWAKLSITIIIVVNALLLHARAIPLWLGFSLSFTSWYAALILGIWSGLNASFVQIMLYYVGFVIIMGFVLDFIKKIYLKS